MNNNLDVICQMVLSKKPDISNLHLQKLLYYIQVLSLVLLNETAFENKIEAWTYGPVVPDAYFKMKNGVYNQNLSKSNKKISSDLKTIVDSIVDNLGKKAPFELVNMTHSYDTWIDAWKNLSDKTINHEKIKKYHKNRLEEEGTVF